jgi:ubiquinone biosynthesis protein UbiJ
MLDLALLQAFNRLLAAAPWARERLAPFAGQRARLILGPLPVTFRIAADGTFESLGTEAPAVDIALPADAPLALLQGQGRDALMRKAHITGSADFAEALGFVLRNLEWDVEEDISRAIGDIAARRLVKAVAGLASAQADAARRLADNFAEYLRYEQPVGVRQSEADGFAAEAGALAAETATLEQRIAALEKARHLTGS